MCFILKFVTAVQLTCHFLESLAHNYASLLTTAVSLRNLGTARTKRSLCKELRSRDKIAFSEFFACSIRPSEKVAVKSLKSQMVQNELTGS